jgi:SAM-dependent methyltransferase
MLRKLLAAFERFQIFCIAGLMLSVAKGRQPDQRTTSDATLRFLLPAWTQLIVSRNVSLAPELVAQALSSFLKGQSDTVSLGLARSLLLNQLPAEAWPLIPSLDKRDAPVMNTWTFQNEVMKWNIAPNDLVLDIGSGGWPFKRANHLADKYPDKTTHRAETMVRDERPFFEVDLEHLSFGDQAYDFVFCSHVLEHLDNPGQAMRELMRVGRRGYIEVPTRLSDVMFNFTRLPNHHRWHGMVLGDTLLMVEWNDWERRDHGNHFFDALHSEYNNAFQEFFERNRDLFFASYHWDKSINFLIIDKRGQIIDSSQDSGCNRPLVEH